MGRTINECSGLRERVSALEAQLAAVRRSADDIEKQIARARVEADADEELGMYVGALLIDMGQSLVARGPLATACISGWRWDPRTGIGGQIEEPSIDIDVVGRNRGQRLRLRLHVANVLLPLSATTIPAEEAGQ